MRNLFNPALLALALSIGASVDARAIHNDQIRQYHDKKWLGALFSRASDLVLELRAPGIPGLGGIGDIGKGSPKAPIGGGDRPPGTTGGNHPYDGQSGSSGEGSSGATDHPYDGQSTTPKDDEGTGTSHPYDGQSANSGKKCERASPGDPACNTGPANSKEPLSSQLKAASASPNKPDVKYNSLKSEGYAVESEMKNPVDEGSWDVIYTGLSGKIKSDLGLDLRSADSVETTITRKVDDEGNSMHFKSYTSSSQKFFCVGSKFDGGPKYDNGKPKPPRSTGPLKMKAIQQQALAEGLSQSGRGVKPGDMSYFGEVGITNSNTQKIIEDGRAGDISENKISFASDSPTFAALSNSDNGRAEFGQLIDNMGSMRLTIDRVDTYIFKDSYHLFWHLTKV